MSRYVMPLVYYIVTVFYLKSFISLNRFVTHLMRRLQNSQVRGISIKLQEEERERRDNYVPEESALERDIIEIDQQTKDMLKMMEFHNLSGLQLTQVTPGQQYGGGGNRR
ncbi:unnamed protein product [Orchesella dallaii]|uniref:40S ribosomal protein S17 n=1 Tax=Orchesella dallaii TaxID=48710 RepID=A0ABP1Q402_9HEXA